MREAKIASNTGKTNMNPANLALTFLAGLGLAIGAYCAVVMSNTAIQDFKYLFVRPPLNHFDTFYQPIIWIGCTFGLTLASIGGFIARPRYFWPLHIVIGTVYLISTAIVMLAEQRGGGVIRITLMTLWIASPGIVFILEGLVIRQLRKRGNLSTRLT